MNNLFDKIEYIRWRIYTLEKSRIILYNTTEIDRKINSYYRILKMLYKKRNIKRRFMKVSKK